MKNALRLFFAAILVGMLTVTIVAGLDRGVWVAGTELWPDPWFRATLADAYFGFLTIYLWIAYREPTWPRRMLWLALVLTLGNIAIAVYLLLRLAALSSGDGVDRLLLRPEARE